MENRELIYDLAKRLDLVIEVENNGVISYYRFIDGGLRKIEYKK